MKITTKHTSYARPVLTRFQEARVAGLQASANIYRNAILRRLRGGYTSSLGNHGNFVTGLSTGSVFVGEPVVVGDTIMVRVSTPLLYNLYWELGHHNLFTRHFERDEKWSPAFWESRQDALDAFARVHARMLATT